tara:strand:+ start:2854 stop:3069 length:216 start_codon:yes stop_codon:yes gene_type:complete
MATPATLLAQIDTAIEALLVGGASSYSIGSRSVTSLDLPTLFEQRRLLQSEVDRESGGGMFRLAKFQRTSR